MNKFKSGGKKRVKGYLNKAVIYLLIAIILVPYFHMIESRAVETDLDDTEIETEIETTEPETEDETTETKTEPTEEETTEEEIEEETEEDLMTFGLMDVGDWSVDKTVQKDELIAGGGSPNYVSIPNATVADTNVLRYRNEISNNSNSAETVDILVNMPSNCILYLSEEWYFSPGNDGRCVTGISQPSDLEDTLAYENFYYAWLLEAPGQNDYNKSFSAIVTPSGDNPAALQGPFTLTLDNVPIPANSSAVFEYAVIVYTNNAAGGDITDDFRYRISGDPEFISTAPLPLSVLPEEEDDPITYSADILPSQGIIAGQEITYTALIDTMQGTLPGTLSVQIPEGAELMGINSDSGYIAGVPNGSGDQIDFDISGLVSTQTIEFTLKLKASASGNLKVKFEDLKTPTEWEHPILVVTKSLKKNTEVANNNAGYLAYNPLSGDSAVAYKDLVMFIYSIQNTGTIPVSGVRLEAPTPDDMALYITKSLDISGQDAAFGVSNYGDTGIIIYSEPLLPVSTLYQHLTYNWLFYGGLLTDYECSVEAEEDMLNITYAYYGPFTVYKDNISIAPDGGECDFRYAAFVHTDVAGTELTDNFSVNGVSTAPVRLFIPADYGISSNPVTGNTVSNGDEITYTFTMPENLKTSFQADIPLGTTLKPGSCTTTDGGTEITVIPSSDKIIFEIPAGATSPSGFISVSYTVIVTENVKVIINNVNVDKSGGDSFVYLGTISHMTGTMQNGVILGYTYLSHLNNSYIEYADRMTFKLYVYNNTDADLTDIVISVPIDENFRLDPRTVPPWFGDDSVIIDNNGTEWNPTALDSTIIYDPITKLPLDFTAYDALGPFTIQWTIPLIGAKQAVNALYSSTNPAGELGFSGNVKTMAEVQKTVNVIRQTAELTANPNLTASAPELTYYFPPRTFISIDSDRTPTKRIISSTGAIDFDNGPIYKYGDMIKYTVSINSGEVGLDESGILFISSAIPAGATLAANSIKVFDGNNNLLTTGNSDYEDISTPGKARINIFSPEQTNYKIEYDIKITSYKGVLKAYAVGQVFGSATDDSAEAASETNILAHKFDTPMSTVTITEQILVDSLDKELDMIPQNINGILSNQPVQFIIAFTDEAGNEYNAVMKNGDTNLVFYGLPYNTEITVTEIGTSDTVFKELRNISGNSFILTDTDTGRNVSFAIVSEYKPSGGFSSAASRNNRFSIPNLDFTSLLQYQLQDLAFSQLDNGKGDGAIPIADDPLSYNFATQRFSIRPYFSMTAANAFLLDGEYYANTKRYINWHIKHLNDDPLGDVYGAHGSIYDYYYSLIGYEMRAYTLEESNNTVDVYDSTDSYAALFFELLLNYSKTTGDNSVIDELPLDLVLRCLEESFSKSQAILDDPALLLTVAKPNYPMEFLMDNCEVYRGFKCLAELYDKIGKTTKSARAEDYAMRIKLGIENLLWNDSGNCYDYALVNSSDLEKLYPDAIAQLFPIIFGVIEPESDRAKKLYDDFCNYHPNWANMPDDNEPDKYPHVLLVKAAIIMGDLDRASESLKNIEKRYRQTGNEHPFLCFESGETALCVKMFMEAYYKECGEVFTEVPKFK